ncbi:TPA: orotate phosphoribosyltransferase [Candidatus Bathyarchaeota archaeon]|nr:orotate phosphoribosyltransferase [Candidatus Bathyarchaeota archaeon]
MVNNKIEFCKILLKTGAIKFGVFKLTSGKMSPYYIDLRLILSFPDALKKVIEFYEEVARKEVGVENFQRIAGVPTAGLPFASILAFKLDKPLIYVRKEAKAHGRERKVEGLLYPGDKVLVVDDLVTTGKSMVKAVKSIRAEGGKVSNALALIDREEGGVKNLGREKVKLACFIKVSEIVKKLLELGAVEAEKLKGMVGETVK